MTRDGIRIHEAADFAGMHKAGLLAAQILDEMIEHVFPGQTTGEIDRIIEEKVVKAGATSATIGNMSDSSCPEQAASNARNCIRKRPG